MNDDWNIECSDEEYKDSKGHWEPSPTEIDRVYSKLVDGQFESLQWKCPGYRSPSPEIIEQPEQESDTNKELEQSFFDFMDETSSPKLKIRNKGEEKLKGSAKKKTASLDGVINNMRRHNLLLSEKK